MPFRIASRPPLKFFVLALALPARRRLRRQAAARARHGAARRRRRPTTRRRQRRTQPGPAGRGGPRRARHAGRGRHGLGHLRRRRLGRRRPARRHPLRVRQRGAQDEARSTLEKHAAWLQGQRGAQVTIEGTPTSAARSSTTSRSASSVRAPTRDYLVSLGVAQDRLRIVSFGKERPLAAGSRRGRLVPKPPRAFRGGALVSRGVCASGRSRISMARRWPLPVFDLSPELHA